MNDRFLYEIHPVRPFTTKDGKLIKKACSILLTKEEVKEYIKLCPIYRKVSGATNKMVRVTLANLDDLHTPTGKAVVNTPVVEEKKEEVVSVPVESEKIEESTKVKDTPVEKASVEPEKVEAPAAEPVKEEFIPVEEAPIASEKVEESTEVESTSVEEDQNTEEESIDEVSEDTDEETTESVDDILKEGTVQSNYQGKKKHRHH